jgi:hypothetical protein
VTPAGTGHGEVEFLSRKMTTWPPAAVIADVAVMPSSLAGTFLSSSAVTEEIDRMAPALRDAKVTLVEAIVLVALTPLAGVVLLVEAMPIDF